MIWTSRILILSLLGFMQPYVLLSQENDDHSVMLVEVHYGMHMPGGDLDDRYGTNFNLGGNLSLLRPSGLYLGLTYNFLFGTDVKEDVLHSLRTIEGLIVGRDQQFANVFLRQRGHYAGVLAGKAFPIKSNDSQRSGILIAGGLGILQHKIRFVDDFDSVSQLFDPYHKGYDRLSRGLALFQHIGYLHLGKDDMINFFAGFDLVQGMTKNKRGFDYDLGTSDNQRRTDLLFGLRAGWIFPIHFGEREIYY